MKTNIKYSIVEILFWIAVLSVSLIAFVVLLNDTDFVKSALWVVIMIGAFSVISIIALLLAIANFQWFDIANGYITIYAIFGAVKQVHLKDVKIAFKIQASIFRLKAASIGRKHIVLSQRKSLTKADIVDAYNKKKHPYLIVPYSVETENLICMEYKKFCGEELVIK